MIYSQAINLPNLVLIFLLFALLPVTFEDPSIDSSLQQECKEIEKLSDKYATAYFDGKCFIRFTGSPRTWDDARYFCHTDAGVGNTHNMSNFELRSTMATLEGKITSGAVWMRKVVGQMEKKNVTGDWLGGKWENCKTSCYTNQGQRLYYKWVEPVLYNDTKIYDTLWSAGHPGCSSCNNKLHHYCVFMSPALTLDAQVCDSKSHVMYPICQRFIRVCPNKPTIPNSTQIIDDPLPQDRRGYLPYTKMVVRCEEGLVVKGRLNENEQTVTCQGEKWTPKLEGCQTKLPSMAQGEGGKGSFDPTNALLATVIVLFVCLCVFAVALIAHSYREKNKRMKKVEQDQRQKRRGEKVRIKGKDAVDAVDSNDQVATAQPMSTVGGAASVPIFSKFSRPFQFQATERDQAVTAMSHRNTKTKKQDTEQPVDDSKGVVSHHLWSKFSRRPGPPTKH